MSVMITQHAIEQMITETTRAETTPATYALAAWSPC